METHVIIGNVALIAIFAAATAFVRWRSRGERSWWSSYRRAFFLLFFGFLCVWVFFAPIFVANALLYETGHSDLSRVVLPGVIAAEILIIVVWWMVVRHRRRRRLEKELERERSLPFAKLRDF